MDTPTFSCDICLRTYKNKKHLKVHQLIHKEPEFSCEECKKHFFTKDKLKRHKESCNRIYECHICKKTYTREKWFNIHSDKHRLKKKRNSKNYECKFCKFMFANSKSLRIHEESVHLKIKKFHCDCGKSYYHKRLYDMHVDKIHTSKLN